MAEENSDEKTKEKKKATNRWEEAQTELVALFNTKHQKD